MSESVYKNKLIDHLDRIESAREDLFSDLDALSETQLHFRKSPEKWNILQILDHLMISEKLTVVYIKRKTSSGKEFEKSGVQTKFRILVLKLAFVLPFKYKAPKVADTTGKDPDFEELTSGWKQIRKDTRELIQNLDDDTLKCEIFKHPIVGMLNMKQTLKFFEIHFNHHKKQIFELINHPLYPKPE